mmetsp:Transcript_8772/g.20861  ORF Transcript_8772/g.20861 Transcript_8772/m.20861 type:complete len:224 (+) Transcript_8772:57-728(+)
MPHGRRDLVGLSARRGRGRMESSEAPWRVPTTWARCPRTPRLTQRVRCTTAARSIRRNPELMWAALGLKAWEPVAGDAPRRPLRHSLHLMTPCCRAAKVGGQDLCGRGRHPLCLQLLPRPGRQDHRSCFPSPAHEAAAKAHGPPRPRCRSRGSHTARPARPVVPLFWVTRSFAAAVAIKGGASWRRSPACGKALLSLRRDDCGRPRLRLPAPCPGAPTTFPRP